MTDFESRLEAARQIAAQLGGDAVKEMMQLLAQARLERVAVEPEVSSMHLPETDAAIRAALADSFSIEEIGATEDDQPAILANAELVMVGGKRRLRLTDESRGDLLRKVHKSQRYQQMLAEAVDQDEADFDPITGDDIRRPTAWLRAFLAGRFGNIDEAPPLELRSALSALERLRLAPLPAHVPPLDEIRRRLEFAELIEPLRLLIGGNGGWEGRPPTDRFVGRRAELRDLRSYVDELASESKTEAISRAIQRVGRNIRERVTGRSVGAFGITASGGVGKSTLIAKFVWDHALHGPKRIPFTYFDFDRATLRARDPRVLLIEAAKQVALQFPEVSEPLDAIRGTLRAELAGEPTATEGVDPFHEFTRLVREHVTRDDRNFLLVLDTMEVVQYDPKALQGVATFVERITGPGFPELRIVVSGRAPVPELMQERNTRAAGTVRELGALTVREAEEMANLLGERLLGSEWHADWGGLIAGESNHPDDPDDPGQRDDRREPLSVRVAVEELRSAKDLAARQQLADEIGRMGIDAHHSFVGKLYERRVLAHIMDDEARKLAWPGLVVRKITHDIIRDLLAGPCKLDKTKINTVYDALAKEVWLVTSDGSALRHLPDLRAKTLPLMEKRDSVRFHEVNSEAIRYFGERRDNGLEERAEWIYHRLLGGEAVESVDRDWREELASYLADAPRDFSRKPHVADYLLARTATRLLAPEQILRLPPRLAVEHVARTSQRLGAFDDHRIEPLLVALPVLEALLQSPSETVAAASASLAVKTGQWRFKWPPVENPGTWANRFDFALRFRRARTGEEPLSEKALRKEYKATDSRIGPGFRGAAQDLAAARIHAPDLADIVDQALVRWLEEPETLEPGDVPILRTIMVFGLGSLRSASGHWLVLRRKAREGRFPTLCAGEFHSLMGLNPSKRRLVLDAFKGMDRGKDFLKRLDNPLAHVRLMNPAISKIQDTLSFPPASRAIHARAVSSFAAARDQDWIVPMAYAASRATGGKIPSEAEDWLEEHDFGDDAEEAIASHDPLVVLRHADEAGALHVVASLFADAGGDTAESLDLRKLLAYHAEWRFGIERALAYSEPP